MKTFEITLKHDGGQVTIRTRATCLAMAQNIALTAEKAPRSALAYWGIVPTQRQIARTKNMLRNL
jgi:hypothetical protein